MDKITFGNLYTEVALSADCSLLSASLPKEYKAFNISVKTRTGAAYKIARRKAVNGVDVSETKIYQVSEFALLVEHLKYAIAIPYEEIVEIYAEATKD